MKRIQVVGNSGSGKSTLSAKIAAALGIPHIELDALFHKANWSRPEESQFLSEVDQATQSDRWVVDGNYSSVRTLLWEKIDTLIFIDIPLALALFRTAKRSIKRIITREVLWGANRETWGSVLSYKREKNLLLWTLSNFKKRRALYLNPDLSVIYPNLSVIHLRSKAELAKFLENLDKQIDQ